METFEINISQFLHHFYLDIAITFTSQTFEMGKNTQCLKKCSNVH